MPNNKQETFRWKFKGDIDGVPLSLFLESMSEFKVVLEDINKYAGYEKLELNIKTAGKGCFWVDFGAAIISVVQPMSPFISNINDLLEFFSEYLKLTKFLKGKNPENVGNIDQSGNIPIYAPTNTGNIVVNQHTYNFYNNSPKTREKVFKGMDTIKREKNIEGLEIGKKNEVPFFQTDRKGIEEFVRDTSEKDEDQLGKSRTKREENIILTITEIRWGENNEQQKSEKQSKKQDGKKFKKWGFVFREQKIFASIEDEEFSQRIDHHESFAKGDKLLVVLVWDEHYDKSINEFLVDLKSYRISKVAEHIKMEIPSSFF